MEKHGHNIQGPVEGIDEAPERLGRLSVQTLTVLVGLIVVIIMVQFPTVERVEDGSECDGANEPIPERIGEEGAVCAIVSNHVEACQGQASGDPGGGDAIPRDD